jgi:hypothetical protein
VRGSELKTPEPEGVGTERERNRDREREKRQKDKKETQRERKELLIHEQTWRKFRCILLSERCQYRQGT